MKTVQSKTRHLPEVDDRVFFPVDLEWYTIRSIDKNCIAILKDHHCSVDAQLLDIKSLNLYWLVNRNYWIQIFPSMTFYPMSEEC